MRLSRSLALGLLVVLGTVPALGQPAGRQAVVATVEDDVDVTMGELRDRAERIFYRGVMDPTEQLRIALKEATLERLKGRDFFRLGYDEEPAFLAGLGPRYAEELLVAYYEQTYEEPFLNEDAIRAQHEAMGRVVFYRQIVLRKPPGATPATLAALRETVEEVRRQLDEGASVEALVARYSEDEASVRTGGLMAPVTWERSTRSPMMAVTFRLEPGEALSLDRGDAFVIVVGERVEEVPVPPLAQVRPRIVEVQRGRYSEQANQAYYEERQATVDSTTVRWNDEVVSKIVEWARTPGFFETDYAETVRAHVAESGDAVVFTDSAGELRLSELPRLIGEVLAVSRSSGRHSVLFVRDYLLEAVRADRMVDVALELGLDEELMRPGTPSPVLAEAFEQYYDRKRIEARLPEPTEPALRAFYEAHADSLFYQLPTVYTEVIERETEAEADDVWARLQAGTPFEDASDRRLRRSFGRTRDGEIVARFIQEPPYLGEVAFGLGEGEVTGPVAYDTPEGRRYAVVKATRRLDERQLGFDEVRERVVEAFTEHHRERLAAEVEAELRERYAVEVDEALWARVLGGPQ
ncbi:peptidylprolyl isomerase [Rubrivirga marina]|uniref:PpiC domain-containing protein n=1 Tax=Rubrivirga marina TaxID=1196024 RepID=A0A271IUV4_9BACT|nr:peptidyl-prolyl cis-trans isomerase [Rubrivirga marina]PAP75031.1 hypothetical protein BSZ37_00465 [Rubrivirga marina]